MFLFVTQRPFNVVTYTIIDGSDKFAIDSLGRVTLRQTLPQGRYTARIRASDGGVPSKSTDEALTVIIGESTAPTECPQFASGSLSRTVTILETQNPEVGALFLYGLNDFL